MRSMRMLASQLHECFLVDRHGFTQSRCFHYRSAICFLSCLPSILRITRGKLRGSYLFVLFYIIANYPSHSAYSMPSTMEQQSTSVPSIESPPGAQTDPLGTTNKLEQAFDQLNANMDMMSTLLGQLCQHIPTGAPSSKSNYRWVIFPVSLHFPVVVISRLVVTILGPDVFRIPQMPGIDWHPIKRFYLLSLAQQ